MLSAVLPIFPLPNAVLFPGVFLPLHIFETRYREMVADVLAGDRLIGMVLLKPGWDREPTESPSVFSIGCAGLISHVEQMDDGRYNIVLRGIERFRIVDEEVERSYRLARVDYLVDTMTTVDREALRRQRHKLERLLTVSTEAPDHPFPSSLSDEEVINALAQYVDLEPIERQALLECDTVSSRSDALAELLEMKAMAQSAPPGRGLLH
ncbi:MAG: LON peptidase substrate-binding domain-containing protein [Acidobacteria bacterium]|jgi:Lon protease-like protein|nr:LON peptidase substrate-binding domain-containing protein [Acidobacteriota bacterium]